MSDTILVYGNCQAGVYADLLQKIVSSGQHVVYVKSFNHPLEETMHVTEDALRRCILVVEQVDSGRPMPEYIRRGLPGRARVIRFPPLDFNLLWPFNFADPRNVSEPPDYPFGRFPYGDRIVVELLREGLAGADLWAEYQKRSVAKLPDLKRLQMHEERRLTAREERAEVKVASIIIREFKARKLFWTLNHPTGWLLSQVFAEILMQSEPWLHIGGNLQERAMNLFAEYEPFGHQDVPIHPEVAIRVGLQWWNPAYCYKYLDGSMLTFEQTMLRYIDFR